jgi:LPXTG-motif cell wall-anchored protein
MKLKVTAVMIATLLSALIFLPLTTAGADTDEVNKALVSFEPSSDTSGICIDPSLFLLAASYSTINTADSFTVKVELKQNLCSPFVAKAAVYSMPGSQDNQVAWPQELVSVQEFSIQARGTYTVTFPKTCLAQQFDIIVGATPQTISPTGPYHGPLLFPVGLSSALQWWGFECVEDTTVSTEDTTTTTTSTTTTTQPTTEPTVQGTSVTSDPGDPGDPADPAVEVKGVSVGTLPVTGSDSNMIAYVGATLLLAGTSLALATRRRRGLLR